MIACSEKWISFGNLMKISNEKLQEMQSEHLRTAYK